MTDVGCHLVEVLILHLKFNILICVSRIVYLENVALFVVVYYQITTQQQDSFIYDFCA